MGRELVVSKNLEKGDKTSMIDRLIDFEAKEREVARALEAKAREAARIHAEKVKGVVKNMRAELNAKGNDDLKEMCRSKTLGLGGSKVDKIARLLEVAEKAGEVQQVLDKMALDERRAHLLAMNKDAVLELCQQAGVDPLVKEVMVERLILSEATK